MSPDSRFRILPLPGKPRIWPRLGSHGKIAQINPRLPKSARFRCQIMALNRFTLGDLLAISNHPAPHEICQKNAAKYAGRFWQILRREFVGTTGERGQNWPVWGAAGRSQTRMSRIQNHNEDSNYFRIYHEQMGSLRQRKC